MAEDSLAILPSSMGRQPPGTQKKKADPSKFIPTEKGGLLMSDPKEESCPYTFSDSPAYLRNKSAQEAAKREAELEGKEETRGFLRSVEELAKKHKWDEAYSLLERRTAVPSGLFLVTRALLRWKFGKYWQAVHDAEDALVKYGGAAKAGPVAAALASIFRICLGSQPREKGSCSKEMRDLVEAWEQAEQKAVAKHPLGQGLFQPRQESRLAEPLEVDGMEAADGTYSAAPGVRVGYVFLRNKQDASAPVMVHFHGNRETAADYRAPALARRYCDLGVHLLVVDYRGYGWSSGEPSLASFLRDAEPLAEHLPEIFIQHGLPWPYSGGLILSGRSLGAQVAVHLATLYPSLFRGVVLDSALAASAAGGRLGRGAERGAALERWRKELEGANLESLQPLDAELWCLSPQEKLRAYEGSLLVLHGAADELAPPEGSEGLLAAAGTSRKELVLIEGASHNDIGRFDAYWSALRRLALKVQLDSSLPSVSGAVEHFCAVCAEKAASKCGRCQRVWYCGRAHQAEHWKAHKLTCAGGPPEPKAPPEGDACLVAFVAAEIADEQTASSLASSMASAAKQEEALQALCVSWHAASQDLADLVKSNLEALRAERPTLVVTDVEAGRAMSYFEHIRVLTTTLPQELPQHAWVELLLVRGIWSPRHVALLLPVLRKAAPDQRVVGLVCSRSARPRFGNEACTAVDPSGPQHVDRLLAAGEAEVVDEPRQEVEDLVVRVKVLQAFIEGTPAQVLGHHLCGHRLHHKLVNAFGKKVQAFVPPDGEWMCWNPCPLADEGGASSSGPGRRQEEATQEADRQIGQRLFDGVQQAFRQHARDQATNVEGACDAPVGPWPGGIDSLEAATCAATKLRRRLERRLVIYAGEDLLAKDLRAVSTEHMHSFLEEVGLDKVIGIERWAREVIDGICQDALHEFGVKVTTAQ